VEDLSDAGIDGEMEYTRDTTRSTIIIFSGTLPAKSNSLGM
jgi:hypothetical protein